MEGPIAISDCFLDLKVCSMLKKCAIRGKLREAQERMLEVFRETTIADLVREED